MPSAEFGYVVPSQQSAGPASDGRTVAMMSQRGWERRPAGMVAAGAKRTGQGGGFQEFNIEEEEQRKRRAMEDRQQKESRKAEKKKCAYCKRFACLC